MINHERSGENPVRRKMWKAFEKDDFADIVERYERMGYGGQTPVPHECISEWHGEVRMNEECTEYIKIALEYTQKMKKELPFMMVGRMNGDMDAIDFDKFYTVPRDDIGKLEAQECDPNLVINGNPEMLSDFRKAIIASQLLGGKAILCFGHTHPDITRYYGTYDTQDLSNAIQHDESIDGVRRFAGDKKAETIDCVVMANGDIDFMYFDKANERYRKAKRVWGTDESGKKQKIQNYQFKTPYPTD